MIRAGFINPRGAFEIEPTFDQAKPFTEPHRAAVQKSGKWTFIDQRGRAVFDRTFDDALAFQEGLASVKSGDRWGFIDVSGALQIPYRFSASARFSEQCCAAKLAKLYGYVDLRGAWIVEPRFRHASRFSEGLAAVAEPGGQRGYIDRNGKVIIPYQFLGADEFQEGLATVRIDDPTKPFGRDVVIDRDGITVISNQRWGFIGTFSNGYATFKDLESGLLGYIDTFGNVVIPPTFESAMAFCSPNVTKAKLNGKCGLIDREGRWICKPTFADIWPFSEVLAPARDFANSRWGFVNETGDVEIPFQYAHAMGFSNGLAAVCIDS